MPRSGTIVRMRIGLVGDVHAEDQRLEVALAALRVEGAHMVLCTGDVVDGLGDVDRACALLAQYGVLTVRGNHDRWIRDDTTRALPHAHRMTELAPESIAFLKALPPTRTVPTPDGILLLCHGVGENDMTMLRPSDRGYALSSNDDLLRVLFDPRIAIMVGGHTHLTMMRRFERGDGKSPLWVVNPGTLARENQPGFAVLDLVARHVSFFRIGADLGVRAESRGIL